MALTRCYCKGTLEMLRDIGHREALGFERALAVAAGEGHAASSRSIELARSCLTRTATPIGAVHSIG